MGSPSEPDKTGTFRRSRMIQPIVCSSRVKTTKILGSWGRKKMCAHQVWSFQFNWCITSMLKDLELPPLAKRRKHQWLIFKVANGLIHAAVPPDNYLVHWKTKVRHTHTKQTNKQTKIRLQDDKHCRPISKGEHPLLFCTNYHDSHLQKQLFSKDSRRLE